MAARGGARENSGPKKDEKDFEKSFIDDVKRYIGELEEENGEHPVKAALRLIYSDDTQDSVKASILKTICEFHKQPVSKMELKGNLITKPAIRLPPRKTYGNLPSFLPPEE